MSIVLAPNPSLRLVLSPSGGLPTTEVLANANQVRRQCLGVAIAANQVADHRRWFLMEDEGSLFAVANCLFLGVGKTKNRTEGCLSIPGPTAKVPRYESISIAGQIAKFSVDLAPATAVAGILPPPQWNFDLALPEPVWSPLNELWTGTKAHIAQHEIDHLNGKLFVDHLSNAERSRVLGIYRKTNR